MPTRMLYNILTLHLKTNFVDSLT